MAQCPKCGRKLHIYNWQPNCPQCGVNIMFAGYEGQFEKDRRITEMTLARTRSNFVKFKCSFTGSLLSKLRIITALLPLAGLFISFGSFSLITPIYEKAINFNILGVVGAVTEGYLFNLGAYSGGPVIGSTVSALAPVLFAYLAVAVLAIMLLLSELLSFFNFKATSVVMSVMGVLGVAATIATEVFLYKLSDVQSAVCSVDVGAGFYSQAICFIPIVILSLLLARQGVPYSFAPGDEKRVAYYRKYKKGKIQLMDIPYPIFCSEAEAAEKARLTKELFNISDEPKEKEAREEMQHV